MVQMPESKPIKVVKDPEVDDKLGPKVVELMSQ